MGPTQDDTRQKDSDAGNDRDWLQHNPEARSAVEQGIEDAREGRISDSPQGYVKRSLSVRGNSETS